MCDVRLMHEIATFENPINTEIYVHRAFDATNKQPKQEEDMKIFRFAILILMACVLFGFAFIGCNGDSNNNVNNFGEEVAVAWFNIAIYHGGPDREIYQVHGSNIDTEKYYLFDPEEYTITYVLPLDPLKIPQAGYWKGSHTDHMYIDAFTIDDGCYNALYVTGNLNLSLASCQNEDHECGHKWGGANLGVICPGGVSGNWLNNSSWGTGSEHTTKSNTDVKWVFKIESPASCDGDRNSIWIYTFSGDGSPIPNPPTLTYDDVATSTNKRVPKGDWIDKCDWRDQDTAKFHHETDTVTMECQDSSGKWVHNRDFYYGPTKCPDMSMNVNDDGKLGCI